MTWHWNPHQSTFDLYDHNGDLVREDVEFGGSWTGDFPDEVFDEMYEEAVKAFQNSNRMRLLKILACAAFERIEQGTP